VTVFVIAAILVVVVILGFAASVERRVRRYRASTAASLTLLTVELERRFVQLEPLIAAVEPSGLNSELVRQLVGARSWSKAVRERELGLPVQAAAENALSAAVHAVLSEADTRPNLKSNWAIQGPAASSAQPSSALPERFACTTTTRTGWPRFGARFPPSW